MRCLVTGRSCRVSERSLALRPRLSAGLPCFRPDPAAANLATDTPDPMPGCPGPQWLESTVRCVAA